MASNEQIKLIKLGESVAQFRLNLDLNSAIRDILNYNYFSVVENNSGAYALEIGTTDNHRLVFSVENNAKHIYHFNLPLRSFRTLIRDYFMILESHQQAMNIGQLEKIEAIDIGRRSVHNEGAELLIDLLENKINLDFETARNLFTIIATLHTKNPNAPQAFPH